MDNIFEVLGDYYDIKTVNEFSILQSGSTNIVWKISDGKRNYVLKKINREFDSDWIQWTREIVPNLNNNEINNGLITNINGNYFTQKNSELWSLSTFIVGENFKLGNNDQLKEVASFLQRLQQIDWSSNSLNGYLKVLSHKNEIYNWYKCTTEKYLEFTETIKKYSQNVDCSVIKLLLSNIDYIVSRIDDQEYDEFKMVPSHGEIQGQNMIFNRNKLVSLIDWDSLSIRPRVYDIAMSAIFLSRKKRGSFHLCKNQFLNYLSEFQLTHAEKMSVFPTIIFYLVPNIKKSKNIFI